MRLSAFLVALALFGLLVPTASADNGRGVKDREQWAWPIYHVVLASGRAPIGQNDPNVTVTPPDAANRSAVVCSERPDAWASPLGFSRWISTQADCTANFAENRDFVYSVGFTLPANPGPVRIQGRVLSDNEVTVRLNDHELFKGGSFTEPATFGTSEASWFKSGPNTLTFTVRNGTGPSGLDFVASVSAGSVAHLLSEWRNHGQCVSVYAHQKSDNHGQMVRQAARFWCWGELDD